MKKSTCDSPALRALIEKECAKRDAKQQLRAANVRRGQAIFRRRTGTSPPTTARETREPPDPQFDVRRVRRNARSLVFTLRRKLESGDYEPRPLLDVSIPKKSGSGHRTITLATIPDAAVSKLLFRRLMRRHLHRLSAHSYAYRADRDAVHGVERIAREVAERGAFFVLQFDLKECFDNISHDYLAHVLRDVFHVGEAKRAAILAIVRAPRASGRAAYRAREFARPTQGLPQGLAVSAFLINAVLTPMDDELARLGVVFVRYGDDITILARTLADARAAEQIVRGHATTAGAVINEEKSTGICFFGARPPPGVPRTDAIELLGYRISPEGVSVATKSIGRIKKRLAQIVYRHLVGSARHVGAWTIEQERLELDWMLRELRNCLYGERVSERAIRNALAAKRHARRVVGCIGRYRAANYETEASLKELDSWLTATVAAAYKHRLRVLRGRGVVLPNIDETDFARASWAGGNTEARLPSAWLAFLHALLVRNPVRDTRIVRTVPDPPRERDAPHAAEGDCNESAE